MPARPSPLKSAIVDYLSTCDRQEARNRQIHQAVEERLGRAVPQSSVRSALKTNGCFCACTKGSTDCSRNHVLKRDRSPRASRIDRPTPRNHRRGQTGVASCWLRVLRPLGRALLGLRSCLDTKIVNIESRSAGAASARPASLDQDLPRDARDVRRAAHRGGTLDAIEILGGYRYHAPGDQPTVTAVPAGSHGSGLAVRGSRSA
jgi:hypothetical protein